MTASKLGMYPRMRWSGVSWLGEIPEHWKLRPNRCLFREIKIQGHETEDMLSVTIARGVMRQADLLANTSKKDSSNLDKSKYKLAEPGDLVYNKMRAWQGAIGLSAHRGIVSPAYIVQRLRAEGLPRYFHYLFRTSAFAAEAERWSYGITSDQWSLRPQHFKMIYSCLPPIPDQKAVVRFIEDIDRLINAFVRKKRELIALLSEEIEILTDRVISAGLNESAKRRSSGVRWVSEIPSHWEMKRLQHLLDPSVSLAYGILLPGPRLDEGVPYIGAGDVRSDRLRLELLPRTSAEIADAYPRTRMRAGEIVYAIRGSFGRVEVIPPELDGVNLSRDAARLTPRPELDADWLVLALRSRVCQQQFDFREIGATITGVNIRDLKRVLIPVPPEKEQAAIVRHVREMSASPRLAIDTATREIDLIREYRDRLITDVVTGKLDVREIAAELPDAFGAPEPLEYLNDAGDRESREALSEVEDMVGEELG